MATIGVQVMDSSGQFIREFGQEGEGQLDGPSSQHRCVTRGKQS